MNGLRDLLIRLPDVPRWLELRSALLEGVPAALHGTLDAGIVRVGPLDDADLFSIGKPSAAALEAAVREASDADLIVVPDDQPHFADMLGTAGTRIFVSRLGTQAHLDVEEDVEWLNPGDPGRLSHLPEDLRGELIDALKRVPVAAVIREGLSVSFCYAGSISERLWDVSIDTYAPYRRRGLAMQALRAVAARMKREGKDPVWCAAEDNPPSVLLARKLGFEVVDDLFLYTPSMLSAAREPTHGRLRS